MKVVCATGSSSGAIQLLEDYATAIDTALKDTSGNKSTVQKLAWLKKIMGADSFETFLPMSDSICIVASDADNFIVQLSNFLKACFEPNVYEYAHPTSIENPTKVKTKSVTLVENQFKEEDCDEIWRPVLFRGGVTFGEVQSVNLPRIVDSKSDTCRSIIGKAVVEAVRLERKSKGPRLLCSAKFKDKAVGTAKEYIGPRLKNVNGEKNDETEVFEIYWPMILLENTCSMDDALSVTGVFRVWLTGVANLYMHFRNNSGVGVQYEAFLRLLIASALRKYPEGESKLKEFLRKFVTVQSPLKIGDGYADTMRHERIGVK